MTAPRAQLHRQAGLTREYVDQINAIAQDAARRDDAGRWGIDGWIRLIHNLLDLQVRTYATAVQATLAGPSWWLPPTSTRPLPADPVDVPDRDYPRSVSVAAPFTRIGRGDIRIPLGALVFEPPVLAAGDTSVRVVLTDDRFVGANYTGMLRLRRTDGVARESDTVTVTVGL
ncbi:hypothetical protein BayCH28_12775 [Mycolicibacterium sp. CH28]|uniref:hypothetical protein n=1 Tax=Mycolicibacterium sp. CH28 TaxID=2512237 RepID=UPI001080673E|nr:hypothetical protein [Mycolicibacterium sp. CH28]TGD87266.1 hypothetical protein BayCH28_12775 [Mycolicibacterium sp. CH28]